MRRAPRWSEDEDAVLRSFYPTPKAFILLSHRTKAAIRSRAYFLGLFGTREMWSAAARRQFPIDAKTLSNSELSRLYGKTIFTVKQRKVKLGVRLDRPADTTTGLSELAIRVRERASEHGISLKMVASGCGFSPSSLNLNQLRSMPSSEVLGRAAELLGGELYAVWED